MSGDAAGWEEYRRSNPSQKTAQGRLPAAMRPRVAEHHRKLKFMQVHRPACSADWLAFHSK